jgi:NADPH:quinone reductase-like Zn-dependent oxidoreductase
VKAVVWTEYGPPDVLQIEEVEKPVPKDNEVLIRIHAATVTMGDCEIRSLRLPLMFSLPLRFYYGFMKPKRATILGMEFAGEIESVGKNVEKFKVGDQIFGTPEMSMGTYAEYKCLPENGVFTIKPKNATFGESAAAVVGVSETLHFLGPIGLKKDQKVLIIGAGGSIGTAAVQYARSFGAHVTAVDLEEKHDMLRSIGANEVIDHTKEDLTKRRDTFDVIFDTVGKGTFKGNLRSLKKNGILTIGNPRLRHVLQKIWASIASSKKMIIGITEYDDATLEAIKDLIQTEKIIPVIDRRFDLEQVQEAHRYVESGQKKGNVIISIIPRKT